jgi:hypothetical protein
MNRNAAVSGGMDSVGMPSDGTRSHTCGAWLFPEDVARLRDLQDHLGGVSASEVLRRAIECMYDEMNGPANEIRGSRR